MRRTLIYELRLEVSLFPTLLRSRQLPAADRSRRGKQEFSDSQEKASHATHRDH